MSEPSDTPMSDSADLPLLASEVDRRRTFAIISHPDAGKTTLTEKLLYFGDAIQIAGAVRARKAGRHAVSDWMKMEQDRGISVTTSVMSFEYPVPPLPPAVADSITSYHEQPGHASVTPAGQEACVNLLDTPGHADFGEDTYRVLRAVDSALMVIDGAKGVEERTRRLIEICRMRDTPVVTFVNKFDRECQPPVELLDEIEEQLGMPCVPVTWPVGQGKTFKGIYDLWHRRLYMFRKSTAAEIEAGGRTISSKVIELDGIDDPRLDAAVGSLANDLRADIELLEGAAPSYDHAAFLAGKQTPLLFGSAMNNFGVQQLLETFVRLAPAPTQRNAITGPAALGAGAPGEDVSARAVDARESKFSGFVFKIQANMDPRHRDRMAFLRICSGQFERGMKAYHCRTEREINLGNATTFLARSREIVEIAYPGDIIGIPNHGTIKIGDTFTRGELLRFTGIPSFAPELFRRVILKSPLKAKQLARGLAQLAEEGAIQVFKPLLGSSWVVGAVGLLQIEVMQHRLEHEYQVMANYTPVDYTTARWVSMISEGLTKTELAQKFATFKRRCEENLYTDGHGDLVYLAPNQWNLQKVEERYPEVRFEQTREHT